MWIFGALGMACCIVSVFTLNLWWMGLGGCLVMITVLDGMSPRR